MPWKPTATTNSICHQTCPLPAPPYPPPPVSPPASSPLPKLHNQQFQRTPLPTSKPAEPSWNASTHPLPLLHLLEAGPSLAWNGTLKTSSVQKSRPRKGMGLTKATDDLVASPALERFLNSPGHSFIHAFLHSSHTQ